MRSQEVGIGRRKNPDKKGRYWRLFGGWSFLARNFRDSYVPRMMSANHSILAYRLTMYLAPVLTTQNHCFMTHRVFTRQSGVARLTCDVVYKSIRMSSTKRIPSSIALLSPTPKKYLRLLTLSKYFQSISKPISSSPATSTMPLAPC